MTSPTSSKDYFNSNSRVQGVKVRRVGLRTFGELAEEFGLKPAQLREKMKNSTHKPPAPEFKHAGGNLMNDRTYYNPIEMRLWWKKHNGVSP